MNTSKMTSEQYVRTDLEHAIEESKKTMAKIKERMDSPFAFLNEVTWFEPRMATVAYAALCETVIAIAERKDGDLRLAIAAVLEETERSVMRNEFRGSSTSAYHNAVDGSKREAACRFVEKARGWIKWMEKGESK